MIFQTQYKAGEDWLLERLNDAYADEVQHVVTVVEKLNASTKISTDEVVIVCNAPFQKPVDFAARCVYMIRNPISQLAEIQEAVACGSLPANISLNQRLQQDLANHQNSAALRQLWKHLTHGRGKFSTTKDNTKRLVVRIEDFVAFPAVTLQRIGAFFDSQFPSHVVKAFMNFGRQRRSFVRRLATDWLPAQNKPDTPKNCLDKNLNLFSWVDSVPAVLAHEIVMEQLPFFQHYYPEIACMFTETAETTPRMVG